MKNDNFITLNLCVNEHDIIFFYVLVDYLISLFSKFLRYFTVVLKYRKR